MGVSEHARGKLTGFTHRCRDCTDEWIVTVQISSLSAAGKSIPIATMEDSEDQDEANARRLIACWNACIGIPIKRLEAIVANGHTLDERVVVFGEVK